MGVSKKREKNLDAVRVTDTAIIQDCSVFGAGNHVTIFIQARDLATQLVSLKKLSEWFKYETNTERLKTASTMLMTGFMLAHPKNQVKRAIFRWDCGVGLSCRIRDCLQSASPQHEGVLLTVISKILHQDMSSAESSTEKRRVIDNIAALLDSAPLGERCIVKSFKEILPFIDRALHTFYHESKIALGEEAETISMHNCLSTVQLFNKLLQKFIQKQTQDLMMTQDGMHQTVIPHWRPDNVVKEHLVNIAHHLWLILNEGFLLDCQTACGMGLPLILKVLFGARNIVKLLHLSEKVAPEAMPAINSIPFNLTETDSSLCCWYLPTSSHLCVLGGILAMFSLEELGQCLDIGQLVFTDVLATNILALTKCLQDTNSKLMASRTVVLLTNKACDLLQKKTENDRLHLELHGDSVVMKEIIAYAWNHWEDPVDTIRHQTRMVFQNIICAHLLATGEDEKTSPFIHRMSRSLLGLSPQAKGRYGPLCCIVQQIGAKALLTQRPNLPVELLNIMGEQALVPYVSELYEKLYLSHKQECDVSLDVGEVSKVTTSWQDVWVKPILTALCSGSNSQKIYIIEYTMPKLLKQCPETFSYIVQQLTCDNETSHLNLGALITCLKQAKLHGMLKTRKNGSWNDFVSQESILQAICHEDNQIRLDAFALLCDNNKTTEVIPSGDLQLIKVFIGYNMESQAPGFRQHMVALLKKLFIRLRDGGRALSRAFDTATKQKKATEVIREDLDNYKCFLHWLCDLIWEQLGPCSAFPRRTTCLAILSMLVNIIGAQGLQDNSPREFHLVDVITQYRIQLLLECFTDTFENNKMEAFSILSALPISSISLQDHKSVESLMKSAIELVSSTRPQDCTTAAYLLRLLLKLPTSGQVACKLKLLKKTDDHHDKEVTIAFLDQRAVCLRLNVQGNPSSNVPPNSSITPFSYLDTICQQLSESSERCLCVVELLLEHLEDQLSVARHSLLHAAATRPLYPVLHCVRYILADINLKSVSDWGRWHLVVEKLIYLSFSVAEIVSPVVSHSSPEGNVPTETLQATGGPGLALDAVLQTDSDKQLMIGAEESVTKVTHMPEYLVVCCWRSIKEVSLLLGQLTQTAPLVAHDTGLLTLQQLECIGEYFTKQLLGSRHRGAFELAYAGFVKMADMMWRCPIPSVNKLPTEWLGELLSTVSQPDPTDKLCATRRSAGVPFYVQALVSMEPSATGRPCFKSTIDQLLKLAWPRKDQKPHQENIPQIHALNILRALYRDTRLGDDVFPYIAEGLQVATLGYVSKLWSIRNSSTLLFSALMTRIFGVKRTKDELSRKNCLTGRVFFHRFPSLHSFLHKQLEDATSNIGRVRSSEDTGSVALHPGLYPLLLVLARLYPSVIEGSDSNFTLKGFIQPVFRCAYSPVYKIRMMAARALAPLVSSDEITDVMHHLVNQLPASNQHVHQNALHGILLQIQQLLGCLDDLPDSMQLIVLQTVISQMKQTLWILSSENPCFMTRTAYLQTVYRTIMLTQSITSQHTGSTEADQLESIVSEFYSTLQKALSCNVQEFHHIPGAVEFLETSSKCLLELTFSYYTDHKNMKSAILLSVEHEFYEVRIQGLRVLLQCLRRGCHLDVDDFEEGEYEPGSDNKLIIMPEAFENSILEDFDISTVLKMMLLKNEKHPECVRLLLDVFSEHSETRNLPWIVESDKYTAQQVVTIILEEFLNHRRDGVRCSALCVTIPLINSISADMDSQEHHDCVRQWLEVLEDKCSTLSSVQMRWACAKSVVNTASNLLRNIQSQSGDLVFRFWTVIIRLFQDEDASVRHQMSLLLSHIGIAPEEFTVKQLQSGVVLTLAVKYILCTNWSVACLRTVLSWIETDIEPDWSDEEQDVRLFDKGEMNTYRDEMTFVLSVARSVLQFAAGDSNEQNPTCLLGTIALHSDILKCESPDYSQRDGNKTLKMDDDCVKFLQQKYQRVLFQIYQELESVPQLHLNDTFTQQTLYQNMSVNICRLCVCLGVVIRLQIICGISDDGGEFREDLQSLEDKIYTKVLFDCKLKEIAHTMLKI